MRCKKCKADMSGETINAEFVEVEGKQKVDVIVYCPECVTQHYFIFEAKELITL